MLVNTPWPLVCCKIIKPDDRKLFPTLSENVEPWLIAGHSGLVAFSRLEVADSVTDLSGFIKAMVAQG